MTNPLTTLKTKFSKSSLGDNFSNSPSSASSSGISTPLTASSGYNTPTYNLDMKIGSPVLIRSTNTSQVNLPDGYKVESNFNIRGDKLSKMYPEHAKDEALMQELMQKVQDAELQKVEQGFNNSPFYGQMSNPVVRKKNK